MSKIHIFSALVFFTFIAFHVQPVQSEDKGQTLLLEKTFFTGSCENLTVNGCGGNVKVNKWLKNEIEVRIYGSNDALKCLFFDVSTDESGINICAKKKAGIEKPKNLNLRYEISVPIEYIVNVLKDGKNSDKENQNSPVDVSKTEKNNSSGR